jgi:sialidase-1
MTNSKISHRVMARTLLAGTTAALVGCIAPADPDPLDQTAQTAQAVADVTAPTILFRGNTANGGANVHHSYRIPAIVSVGSDQLIAVAEGRVDAPDDFGNINLVMRRSLNNGDTWLAQEQIWNAPDRLGTIGNPTLVYDASKGRVWLFASENDSKHSLGGAGGLTPVGVGDRRTWVTFSDDKGASWAPAKNITSAVTPAGTTWDAMGPGVGIQIARGDKAGRLVIPARGRIIISDDHGASWSYLSTRATGSTETVLNETTVAETGTTGWMYVNARSQSDELRRQTKISKDHGVTWSKWASDSALIESECQASLVRYNFNEPGRIMFFNPASTSNRNGMRVRISYDDGATWPISRVVDAGQGGYSSMTKTSDFHIAALYESGGGSDSNRDIKLTTFNLDWIRNGAAEP